MGKKITQKHFLCVFITIVIATSLDELIILIRFKWCACVSLGEPSTVLMAVPKSLDYYTVEKGVIYANLTNRNSNDLNHDKTLKKRKIKKKEPA